MGVLPASPEGWAFFLDIDGTLIDIAPTPEGVVVPPELPAVLERLCIATGGATALLTGRSIATVDRLFAPTRLPVGGIHGTEMRYPDGRIVARSPSPALRDIRHRLSAFAQAHSGALVEDKGTAVGLHFRADPTLEAAAEALTREAAASAGGDLVVQPGKMVFEIRPAHADKGHALAMFMEDAAFSGRRPLSIGDDVTDETMFAAAKRLGGRALRVGAAEMRTVASPGFDRPADLRAWLAGLVRP